MHGFCNTENPVKLSPGSVGNSMAKSVSEASVPDRVGEAGPVSAAVMKVWTGLETFDTPAR